MLVLRRPHSRRLIVLPALIAACALTLTACGGEDSGDSFPAVGDTSDRLDAVTIKGDVGTAPEVTWTSQMAAGAIETTAVTKGDGEALADGASAMAQIWIGNGFTEEESYSTYAEKRAELLTVNSDLPAFLVGIKDATVGSRLAVTGSAEKMFGEAGNATLGISNKDTVLVLIDLVSTVLAGPDGEAVAEPDWMPTLTLDGETPTGFTFEGTPQPTADLKRIQLIKGTGPRVAKGQTIAVRYLGQAFGEAAPFDQNYADGAPPTAFGIGTGQVIKGWDQALDGVPVGSRVVMEVPPDLGYGAEGQPDSGIPANATLVFIVDVLAVA